MAGRKEQSRDVILERFGGSATPMGQALVALAALRQQYDAGESPHALELITLAETATVTINPVLIDDAFAAQLNGSIQKMSSHFQTVTANTAAFVQQLDQFKAMVRLLLGIAGSRPAKAEALGASLDAMIGAYSAMETQRTEIEAAVTNGETQLNAIRSTLDSIETQSNELTRKFDEQVAELKADAEKGFERVQDECRTGLELERKAIVVCFVRPIDLEPSGV